MKGSKFVKQGLPLIAFVLGSCYGLAQIVSRRKAEDDERQVVRATETRVAEISRLQQHAGGGDGKPRKLSIEDEYKRLQERIHWDSDNYNNNVPIPKPTTAKPL
ncbi:mitochondrial CIV assembly protein Cox16 [Andalucia godoyi]|uniref:Mitochondrial CIV assembly protein Cox16 n=1 Tax=Andalucia godoyi TaxID=505711 RepID=A0A8K0AHD1_ANDGO|nr:mitochondrial CIV assembly protein Cox16 [Andalucia godoyi]|eukprot:ANDGO_00978.mRNA.1 mitochondrial CIV assembly protein Cox16